VGENLQVGRESVLVPLIGLEESPIFLRSLVLVRPFHAPLEGWRRVLDLDRRREADEETTVDSTTIEGDEQEDVPEGEDGGEGGWLEVFEAMKDRLEGVQRLRVLGFDDVRGSDGVVSRGVVLSQARTAAALVSTMSTRVDAGTMAAARGDAVSWARAAATLMYAR
jgi:hypothetical protein